MGPHPAVAGTRSAVRALLSADSGRVLVACSGGADSLALAAAAAFVGPRLAVRVGLVTIDHGLQPDSAARAARVAQLGTEFGLDPVLCIAVEVQKAGGPEAAARTARYAALDAAAAAHGAHILLGHTMDDQAETVLLGLGRGSGPRSIAGMQARDGVYLRPFLGLRRATTHAACQALDLSPWNDPHNDDPRYQRVRLRTEVLPLLEDVLQGGVVEALTRTAALLRDDLDVVETVAAAALQDVDVSGASVDAASLMPLRIAIRTRVLRRWLQSAVSEPLSAERTAAVDALVTDWHGQGAVDLPGGASVARRSGRLVVIPSTAQTASTAPSGPPAPEE